MMMVVVMVMTMMVMVVVMIMMMQVTKAMASGLVDGSTSIEIGAGTPSMAAGTCEKYCHHCCPQQRAIIKVETYEYDFHQCIVISINPDQ